MSHQYENIPGIHPFAGASITLSMLLFGRFCPELNIIMHIHMPPIIIELFQIIAYMGTGIVGVVTGYKFFKESVIPKFKKRK